VIAKHDEARLIEIDVVPVVLSRRVGTECVKLSKARPLEGLDEVASPSSGFE